MGWNARPLEGRQKRAVKEAMHWAVRSHVPVDKKTGAPPLWSNLPEEVRNVLCEELRSIADREGLQVLRMKMQATKYVQRLHAKGRKVLRGESQPDWLQIQLAQKRDCFVEVNFAEKPKKVEKAPALQPASLATSAPVLSPGLPIPDPSCPQTVPIKEVQHKSAPSSGLPFHSDNQPSPHFQPLPEALQSLWSLICRLSPQLEDDKNSGCGGLLNRAKAELEGLCAEVRRSREEAAMLGEMLDQSERRNEQLSEELERAKEVERALKVERTGEAEFAGGELEQTRELARAKKDQMQQEAGVTAGSRLPHSDTNTSEAAAFPGPAPVARVAADVTLEIGGARTTLDLTAGAMTCDGPVHTDTHNTEAAALLKTAAACFAADVATVWARTSLVVPGPPFQQKVVTQVLEVRTPE